MGDRADNMFKVYKRSSLYGAKLAYFIDQLAAKCPHFIPIYCYQSPVAQFGGSGFGIIDRMGEQTAEPYATVKPKALIYNA